MWHCATRLSIVGKTQMKYMETRPLYLDIASKRSEQKKKESKKSKPNNLKNY
jgi:hypothetical protein